MRRRTGSILLSVVAFLTIFAGFESFRYHNFVQRQVVYRDLIHDYRQPPVALPANPQVKATKANAQPIPSSPNDHKSSGSGKTARLPRGSRAPA